MKTKQTIFLLLTILLYNSCRKAEKDEVEPLTKVEATVTDFNTGKPVADAWVVLYWEYTDGGSPPFPQVSFDSVKTDANGKCNFVFMNDSIFQNKIRPIHPGLQNDDNIIYSIRAAQKPPYFGPLDGAKIARGSIANKVDLQMIGFSIFKIAYKNLADTTASMSVLVKDATIHPYDVRPYYYNSNNDYGDIFILHQDNDLVLEMYWAPKSNPNLFYMKYLSFQHEYLNTKTYEIIY